MTSRRPWSLSGLSLDAELAQRRRRVRTIDHREREGMFVATENFVVELDGVVEQITAGKSRVRGTHLLVAAYPQGRFQPVGRSSGVVER